MIYILQVNNAANFKKLCLNVDITKTLLDEDNSL